MNNMQTTNSINVSEFKRILVSLAEADQPAGFFGSPGIGKSAIVKSAFDRAGWCFIDVRPGGMMPEDIMGYGVIADSESDTPSVVRAVPDMITAVERKLKETGAKRCCVFIDEIDKAPGVMQGALLQVTLDRSAGMYKFPEGTYVVCGGNTSEDRSYSEDMSRALINRMAKFTFAGPSPEEFDTYMNARDFHPIIQSFLKNSPEYICGKYNPEFEQSPTPRGWESASEILKHVSPDLMLPALAARVGDEAAHKLHAYLDMYQSMTPVSEIMADPAGATLPDDENFAAQYMQVLSVAAEIARIQKVTAHETEQTASDNAIAAGWVYAKRMPVAVGALYITSLTRGAALMRMVQMHSAEFSDPKSAYYSVVSKLTGN